MRRLRVAVPLVLAAALLGRAPRAHAQAEAPGIFILPVPGGDSEGAAPGAALVRDERRLLERRVGVAIGRGRRLRPIVARDLSAAARLALPADLSACVTASCLQILGQATGAAHALALEMLDDGTEAVLFATLLDTRTGAVVERREIAPPATAPATRAWAEEVARWAARATAPRALPPVDDANAPATTAGVAPVPAVALGVGPGTGGPEAQALVAALATGLTARGRPRLVAPGPQVTHRALVSVEQVGVSQRPHHLRHYRTGVLAATLTITEARGGEVIFADRAAVEITERARYTTERQILDALVADVAARWLYALDAQAIDGRLRRSRPLSAPPAPRPSQPIDERGKP